MSFDKKPVAEKFKWVVATSNGSQFEKDDNLILDVILDANTFVRLIRVVDNAKGRRHLTFELDVRDETSKKRLTTTLMKLFELENPDHDEGWDA